MRKILRIDSTGGASGDMILGALHDLGVPLEAIQEAVSGLAVDPFFLTSERRDERGITAQCLTVHIGLPEHDHAHEHGHDSHRHLPDILAILDSGTLPARVRDMAFKVFDRLADAEASVHGIPKEKVHFHEVGAMDSIVDIIGSCWAMDYLGVDAIVCASLPVGHGTLQCAHGTYPLPSPATLALLRDFPMVQTDEPFELVTPTGAALITAWLTPPAGPMIPERIGYGAGHRRLNGRPNVLRATLARMDAGAVPDADEVLVLECNLDDTSGEWMGALMPRLMDAGALDVHYTPCFMKKNRPGYLLRVLCREAVRLRLETLIFEETMTLGIRRYAAQRSVLDRSVETVVTAFGPVRIKVSTGVGIHPKIKPELDDCDLRAAACGVSVRRVHEAALQAYRETKGSVHE